MGGRFYLVGLAVAILQGVFRRGAACSLNNTGSQILKNVVSLFMAFGFCRQTVGMVDLLRSDPGTRSTSFAVHFHWSDVTVTQAQGATGASNSSPSPLLQKQLTLPANGGSVLAAFFAKLMNYWWSWHFRKWEHVSSGRDISRQAYCVSQERTPGGSDLPEVTQQINLHPLVSARNS